MSRGKQEVVGENPKLTNQFPLLVSWLLVAIPILTTVFEREEKGIQKNKLLHGKLKPTPISFLKTGSTKDSGDRESQEKLGCLFLE